MIPLAWIKALKQSDGKPFLADSLARYGYLPNPDPNNTEHLPVGFMVAASKQVETKGIMMTGMTCSACHTREITAQGQTYRIDGGPAIVDFQALLADLDKSVLDVLATDASFLEFARAVLGSPAPDPTKVALLRIQVTIWSTRFHTLMSLALPKDHPWGPSRLDAVSMIFNRLTGLDIGPADKYYLIPSNIRLADAPVRYPFLWNAPIQSMTQWPGFASNGSDILGLSRNLGEIYGVFGTFHPQKPTSWFYVINRLYNKDNSANYPGLLYLETLVQKIGPPEWPWKHDDGLATSGQKVFDRECASCHAQTPGPTRYGLKPVINKTWATPVQDVGTDTHEWDVVTRMADSGSLSGASIPLVASEICPTDSAFNLLAISVLGGIIQYYAPVTQPRVSASLAANAPNATGTNLSFSRLGPAQIGQLRTAFPKARMPPEAAASADFATPQAMEAFGAEQACSAPPNTHAYEARVLYGIWATAPYLHNGSVPSLAELLKPPAQRVKSFKIGPAYDTETVGLAADQSKFNFTLVTTDCSALASGNSNCGHDYGTKLPDADKRALLEYLKVIKQP